MDACTARWYYSSMANNQYNLQGSNDPHWSKPCHLSHLLNQPGKDQGVGRNQAWGDSIPELMNQGGSTKNGGGGTHPDGKRMPIALGKAMGQ